MAYDTLKAEIRQYIKTNGANEITGQILQNVLLDMVNAYPSLDGYATQQWVQNQGYLTSAELNSYATQQWVTNQLGGYLPLTGGGTLTGSINVVDPNAQGMILRAHIDSLGIGIQKYENGEWVTQCSMAGPGYIDGKTYHGDQYIVNGGTSAQFLKADGSVDSTSYLPLTGGTITGNLGVNGYLTFGSNLLYSGNSDFYIGRNNSGAVNTGNARLRLGANLAMLYSGLSYNFFGLDSGGNFVCRLYDALIVIDKNQNDKIILLYSYDEYNGALRTDCDFISDGSVTGSSFIKTGGTSSQFLKADGSVDSNTYLTTAILNGYATETWVGNNYLPLTGGTITSNLAVNGEFDTFSRMQVNGTSADKPFFRLHIPNVNWARLQMDTYGVIHVLDGSHGTSYNGFACGDATMDSITLGRSTSSGVYGSIRFRQDDLVKIYRNGSDDSLVLCADSTAGGGIVLSSSETNPVSIITDMQGGTSINTITWYIYNSGDAYFASVSQTSDIRRKNIISDVGMAIDDIAKAPMFRFTMKDDDEGIVRIGTSAQYWQTVIPEVVSEDKRGVLGLQYDVAALAGVITVAKRVVDHEQRIAELEKENALLKAKLNIN